MSVEVMRDLEKQTGKMKDVSKRTEEMDQRLDEANGIITRMLRRENRNKTIMLASAGVTIFAFLLIVYLKFN
jgi:hypothetical protein